MYIISLHTYSEETYRKLPYLLTELTKEGLSLVHDLTHLPMDKMAAISQTIFSDAFLWMKFFLFWLKFHLSVFPKVQLTIPHPQYFQMYFHEWKVLYKKLIPKGLIDKDEALV